MGTRRIKGRRRPKPAPHAVSLDYYQFPFRLLHAELLKSNELSQPHPLRASYWTVVPPGRYSPEKGRELLFQYRDVVERELARNLTQHSVAYWLHAYRRLAPRNAGENDDAATSAIVRGVMDAAIQKYGMLSRCNGIASSNEVAEHEIIDGLLMTPELDKFRKALRQSPQLVLTKFGLTELRQLYFCEKLAYEVWRCGAALRILGKGAPLVVDHNSPIYFFDDRTEELNRLVSIYDGRQGTFAASASGTVFEHDSTGSAGQALLAHLNVERIGGAAVKSFLARFGVAFAGDGETNFLWTPFSLRSYYDAHEPFAAAFKAAKQIDLLDLLAVLSALLVRIAPLWVDHPDAVVRYWQRAYEGPSQREYVLDEITRFLPTALEHLGSPAKAKDINVNGVFAFLELNSAKRDLIDILLWGPHSVFLPYSDGERVFVDFAWITRLLFNAFFDVQMEDQNFKGAALEKIVRAGTSVLPIAECKALGGTRRQVDAAFKVEHTLVIVECRAVGRSFGVERGDPKAIAYRIQRSEAALRDADEKARWLAANPVGTNYDVRGYAKILPLGVTPFAEYIPTLDAHYWITPELPRVMAPYELKLALSDGTFAKAGETSPAVVMLGPS
jgi:hypothetical protein